MQVVRGEGERLEALVKDFLAFARPASPHLACVEARPLIAETVEVFRRARQDLSAAHSSFR